MPSQKIRVFARGLMSTGTTGDGFIYWAPVLVNDNNNITFTGSTSTGTISTAFNAFGNVNPVGMTKIPYTTTQITGGGVEGRLVSACVRVRYSGSEDQRSGVVSLFEDPDHLGVAGQSATTISTFDSCGKERVSGEGNWHQINWSGPAKQAEMEYVQTATYAPVVIVIAINGTNTGAGAPGPAPFEWEVWENLEFLGRDVVGKTNNKLDPSGTMHVVGSAKNAQSGAEPFSPANPKTTGEYIKSVMQPVPGGSLVGNLVHSAISTFNPGLGRLYGSFRDNFNSRLSSRSRSH